MIIHGIKIEVNPEYVPGDHDYPIIRFSALHLSDYCNASTSLSIYAKTNKVGTWPSILHLSIEQTRDVLTYAAALRNLHS